MARNTLHNIYLLKCTSCSLDFESLGSSKEYPKGRPLCLRCWDTKQERICDTHGVHNCKACKQSRDSYRRIKKKYRDAGFNGPMFRDEKTYRHSRRTEDSSHVGSKIEERDAAATGGVPDTNPLQYID